ncbi:MAG TPA: hypothetical protein VF199_11245 [Bacillales bacterium]
MSTKIASSHQTYLIKTSSAFRGLEWVRASPVKIWAQLPQANLEFIASLRNRMIKTGEEGERILVWKWIGEGILIFLVAPFMIFQSVEMLQAFIQVMSDMAEWGRWK